jgi:spore germination protein KC
VIKVNKKLLFLIPIFFLLTGCWNYQELNSLAISTAMAIDKDDEGYEVSILIANSKKSQVSSKEGESQTVVYSAKGETLSDALKNIDLENPRQTYIGHLSVIIISEDVAKEGLMNTLDLLLRYSESTKRFYIAIAHEYKAKEIIKIISPLETFPSQTISTNIKSSSESQAVSVAITFSKFIENLLKVGISPILPTITIEGDAEEGTSEKSLEQASPDAILKLSTLAIFKDDKLIGYATKDESRGINLMAGKINAMIVKYECDSNYLVSSLSELNTEIKIDFENDLPIATIYIEGNGDITENNCNLKLTDKDVIEKIQKGINNEIKRLINKGLKLLQEDYKSDVIGFGNLIYKKNPNYFKNINNWDEDEFPNLEVKIKTNINLSTKGSARESIKEAIDENQNI